MSRVALKDIFARIQQALEAELPAVSADAIAAYHGAPEEALVEHIVSIGDRRGASVCYSLDPTLTLTEDATRNPGLVALPVVFTALLARTDDLRADNEMAMDLLDAVVDVFSVYRSDYGVNYFLCRNMIYRGVRLAATFADYIALGAQVDFVYEHTPYRNG